MGLYEVGAQVGGRLGSKRGLVLGLGHRSRVVGLRFWALGLGRSSRGEAHPRPRGASMRFQRGWCTCVESRAQLGVQSSPYTGPSLSLRVARAVYGLCTGHPGVWE